MALRHAALAALVATTLACSAASEKTPAPTTCGTHPPVVTASATPSSVEPVHGVVQLTATSTDEDDACLGAPELRTYAWRIDSRPTGSSAIVGDPASPSTTFRPDVAGAYQLEVVAIDAAGHDSAPAFVSVSASACSEVAPTAWLSPTIGATAFNPVTIPAPSVADGNCLATGANTFRWTLLSRPPGSAAVLSDPSAPSPTLVPDVVGPYQVSVVVTSSVGIASAPAFTTIDAARCGDGAPVLPTLVASPSTPNAGQLVSLGLAGDVQDLNQTACGMAVFPYAYRWVLLSRPPGSTAALTSETSPGPSFVADVPGGYQLALTVTDALGNASAPAFLSVTTSACGASAPTITQVRTLQLDPVDGTVTDQPVSRPPVGSSVALVATRYDADEVSGGTCGETPEAPATAYAWTLASAPAGSSVSVSPALQGGTFTFTPDVAGTFVLRVAAIDAHGLVSSPVDVTVATGDCGPDVRSLGTSPSAPVVGEQVTATVTPGGDACIAGGAPPSLAWSIVARPAGSSALLTGETTATPSFVPDAPGGYTLQVVLTDDGGFSTVETTNVVVGGCTSAPVVTGALSAAEIATAWEPDGTLAAPAGAIYRADRVVLALPAGAITPATCGGAASTRYTYQWALVSRPPGSDAQLALANGATPAFVPDVAAGTYQVMVAVTDGNGNTSAPAFYTLFASDCGARAPAADFVASTWTPDANTPATLTAIAPIDPSTRAPACPARFANGSAWTYAWRVVQAPQGAHATLSSDAGAAVTFQADAAGAYVVQLTATGADGTSGSAQKGVVVNVCGSNPPIASAFSAQQSVAGTVVRSGSAPSGGGFVGDATLDSGYPVVLNATVADGDNGVACGARGQTTDYAWSFASLPAESRAVLANPTLPTPDFTPDVPGAYVVQLRTSDPLGYSSVATYALSVGSCGANPPVIPPGGLAAVQPATGVSTTSAAATPPGMAVGDAVQLSATVADADASCAPAIPIDVTYAWRLTQLPAGSAAQLFGATTAAPSLVPDVVGTYGVTLVVTDRQGHASAPATIVVGAQCGAAAPAVVTTSNGVPILEVAQDVPDVSDGTSTRTLSIRRSTDAASSYNNANAGVPLYQGYPVQVAANVVDPDAACGVPQTVSYAWSLVSQPAGSTARLNNASAIAPSFTPDAPGEYDLQLVATDSTGRSSTTVFRTTSAAAVAVSVGTCGSHAPTARIGVLSPYAGATGLARINEPLGATVVLDGGSSDSLDTVATNAGGCGLSRPFAYAWSLVSRPSASAAAIAGASLTGASLVLDADGGYVVQLTVTDGARSDTARLEVGTLPSTIAAVAGAATFSATAVDATGNPVVAWLDLGATTSPVRVARCVANCATAAPTWTTLPDVDDLGATPFTWTGADEPRPLDVKVIGGIVTVLYSTTGPTSWAPSCSTVLSAFTGGTWTHVAVATGSGCDAAGVIAGGYQFGRWVSLADKQGLPAFATSYVDAASTRTTVAYSECLSSDCAYTAALVPATNFAAGVTGNRWPSLAFDAAGKAYLAYTLDGTAAGGVTSLYYGECATGCASVSGAFGPVAVADAAGVTQGRGSRLALDAAGRPRIAYDRAGTGFGVQLASCDGGCGSSGSWTAKTVDATVAGAARGIGFAIASSDTYTVVVRNATTNALRLDVSNDAGASFVGLTPLGATGQPSVAATANGGVYVSAAKGAVLQTVRYGN